MGAYVGHEVGRFVIILSCRDGRKCFWIDPGKVSNFEVDHAFLDKIIGTGRNCKL